MGTAKVDLLKAEELANKIVKHISPAMVRCQVAGSVRRKKPVVGDIEIVGLPADGEELVRLLGEVGTPIKPGVPGVVPWPLKPSGKYMRLHLPEIGCNLDLFNAHELNWGGVLLMRTGSGVDAKGNTFNGFTPWDILPLEKDEWRWSDDRLPANASVGRAIAASRGAGLL